MVNTGKPSTGCGRCRSRKIKCDEGRPSCAKCIRIGKECPGYRNQTELVFRNTNPVAQEAVPAHSESVDSLVPTSGATAFEGLMNFPIGEDYSQLASHVWWPVTSMENAMMAGTLATASAPPDLDSYYSLTPALQPDVQDQSINLFFGTYVSNPRISYNRVYVDFLPGLFANAPPDSCLATALKAAAKATLANHWNPDYFREEVRRDYALALEKMNDALGNPEMRLQDETLLAVWLLGTFEVVTGYTMNSQLPIDAWMSHTDGTLALLRMRGRQQLNTHRGQQLFRLCHVAVQWRALVHGIEPPEDFSDLVKELYQIDSWSSVASARVICYFQQVTKIRARTRKLLSNGDEPAAVDTRSELVRTIRAAEKLDDEMEGWPEDEEGWDTYQFTPESREQVALIPYKAHCLYYFSSVFVYLHWSRYHLARVMLQEAIVNSLLHIASMSSSPNEMLQNKIEHHTGLLNESVSEFLGSVAYALGDINDEGDLCIPHLSPDLIPESYGIDSHYPPTTSAAGASSSSSLQHYNHHFHPDHSASHHPIQNLPRSPPLDTTSASPDINIIGAIRILLPLSSLQYCRNLGPEQAEGISLALRRIYHEMRLTWAIRR